MILIPRQIIPWCLWHWLAKKYLVSHFLVAAPHRKEILKVTIFDLFYHGYVPRFSIKHFLRFFSKKLNSVESFVVPVEIQSLNQKTILAFPDFNLVRKLENLRTLIGE
jgi:hypothetical protein